jgi:hypothetical protein
MKLTLIIVAFIFSSCEKHNIEARNRNTVKICLEGWSYWYISITQRGHMSPVIGPDGKFVSCEEVSE